MLLALASQHSFELMEEEKVRSDAGVESEPEIFFNL